MIAKFAKKINEILIQKGIVQKRMQNCTDMG